MSGSHFPPKKKIWRPEKTHALGVISCNRNSRSHDRCVNKILCLLRGDKVTCLDGGVQGVDRTLLKTHWSKCH